LGMMYLMFAMPPVFALASRPDRRCHLALRFTRQRKFAAARKDLFQLLFSCASCISWFIPTAVLKLNRCLARTPPGRSQNLFSGHLWSRLVIFGHLPLGGRTGFRPVLDRTMQSTLAERCVPQRRTGVAPVSIQPPPSRFGVCRHGRKTTPRGDHSKSETGATPVLRHGFGLDRVVNLKMEPSEKRLSTVKKRSSFVCSINDLQKLPFPGGKVVNPGWEFAQLEFRALNP
jgi:hypothetical protein